MAVCGSSKDAGLKKRLLPEIASGSASKPSHVQWDWRHKSAACGEAHPDQLRAVNTVVRGCHAATNAIRAYIGQRPAAHPTLEAITRWIPRITYLLLGIIAVPFVGSMRRDHEKKTLQRLRNIDDDLRWVKELHDEWTKIDRLDGEMTHDYRFIMFTLRMMVYSINGEIDRL